MKRLFISFSGGETSAFMAQWCLREWADRYDEVICLFANTGQENEETLYFVSQCDRAFGLNVVWVEAEVHHGKRKGNTHRVVDFQTASRAGEPFEDTIRKYGLPNRSYPHCTRELKMNPMISYLRSIGWESYDTAIGIRADEIDRVSPTRKEKRLLYPLVSDVPMTKPDINAWWEAQPFRLPLRGYEGNCKWCWKKSLRKHLTLITDHPDWYEFPDRMEREYGLAGHNVDGTPRTMFRENRSVADLKALAAAGGWERPEDDSRTQQMSLNLDVPGGKCSESCEVEW